jgi:hypothetical protein
MNYNVNREKRIEKKESKLKPTEKQKEAKKESEQEHAEKALRVYDSGVSAKASSSDANALGSLLYVNRGIFLPTPKVIRRRRTNNRDAAARRLYFRTFWPKSSIFEAIFSSEMCRYDYRLERTCHRTTKRRRAIATIAFPGMRRWESRSNSLFQ